MPALLTLRAVAYRHDDATGTLFSDLHLTVARADRVAVVGDNGSGKSTLLQLAAGRLEPAVGSIDRARDARVVMMDVGPPPAATAHDRVTAGDDHLSQALAHLRKMEAAAAAEPRDVDRAMQLADALDDWAALDGWLAEAEADALLHRLGVPDDRRLASMATLSGGERARVELARVLASRADVVLLDEPTEHLDADGVVELERILLGLDAALVFASHDRRLLEAVATRTVQLDRGAVTIADGTYASFEGRRADAAERASRDWAADQRRRGALERAAAQRMATARSMLVDPATGKGTKHFHYRKKAAKVEKTAKVLRHKIEQVPAVDKPFVVPPPPPIIVPVSERGPAITLRVRGARLGWDERALLTGVDLELGRGEHVALVGANGIGKSTLLAAVLGRLAPMAGSVELGADLRIATVAQGLDGLEEGLDVVDACVHDKTDRDARRTALELLAALRVRERSLGLRVDELSAGTRRKVALAQALLSRAHLLVLDEPTNHLDLVARDALGAALASHPAALLVATHDRALLERVGAIEVDVSRWRVGASPGG
jgi:ATP-binding cassette subfamily F protein 3